MNIQEQEERDFHHSSASEWDSAEAREIGSKNPQQAWILTDRDVWHPNPYYTGPKQPHPEDCCNWDDSYENDFERDFVGPPVNLFYASNTHPDCPF